MGRMRMSDNPLNGKVTGKDQMADVDQNGIRSEVL